MDGKGKTAVRVIVSVIATLALVALIVFIVVLGESQQKTAPSHSKGIENNMVESQPKSESSNSNRDESYIGEGHNGTVDYIKGEMMLADRKEYKFDINVGKIEVLPTDKDYAYINYLGDSKVKASVYDDKDECEVRLDVSGKGVNFSNWDERYSIEIYLPENIDKLDVTLNAGNLDMSELVVDDFDLEVFAGNANIEDCKIKKADIKVDAGNADFYADNSTIEIDADVDVGNARIFIPKDTVGFSVKYETGMGNFSDQTGLSVYSSNEGFISKKGIINYGNEALKIEADVDVGNMDLKTY